MPRAVLHLDLDAFFAAVEQRDKPSLRGKPVVVGGLGWRGVVSTASYEARRYDIGSAMPTALARRRCPNAAYLSPRFEAYRRASATVMDLARELSPVAEPLSLDEAYLDLSAHDTTPAALRDLAETFRARVRHDVGLTVSVGLATTKLMAKIASDLGKPDGCVVVDEGDERATLAPLPVRTLPGVGAATQARLASIGLRTVGQLAAADARELTSLLGTAAGTSLRAAALGVDPRPVQADREAKSVSAEETFAVDLTDRDVLAAHLRVLADRVGSRLHAHGVAARTVTLKVRRYDFTTLARSVTPGRPVTASADLARAAGSLLAGLDVSDGVRLIGVGAAGLTDHVQDDLLSALEPAAPPDVAPPAPAPAAAPSWRPGQDVLHTDHGPGWVQGSGTGRVTVRFEGPHTDVGRVRTFALADAALQPADPPIW